MVLSTYRGSELYGALRTAVSKVKPSLMSERQDHTNSLRIFHGRPPACSQTSQRMASAYSHASRGPRYRHPTYRSRICRRESGDRLDLQNRRRTPLCQNWHRRSIEDITEDVKQRHSIAEVTKAANLGKRRLFVGNERLKNQDSEEQVLQLQIHDGGGQRCR